MVIPMAFMRAVMLNAIMDNQLELRQPTCAVTAGALLASLFLLISVRFVPPLQALSTGFPPLNNWTYAAIATDVVQNHRSTPSGLIQPLHPGHTHFVQPTFSFLRRRAAVSRFNCRQWGHVFLPAAGGRFQHVEQRFDIRASYSKGGGMSTTKTSEVGGGQRGGVFLLQLLGTMGLGRFKGVWS
jgi:hypothetical protein